MTLTHRLGPSAAGLTTQKRSASPPSTLDDSPQSKRQNRGMPATIPQLSWDTSPPSYGYRSCERKNASLNQDTGVVEIGTSICMDDASQSTNLDSAYGSRNDKIPSYSNPATPRLSSIPAKFDRDVSAIAVSSNASGLVSSPARQSQLGSAVPDFDNQIPSPQFPTDLDPDLPSHVVPPQDQREWGLDSVCFLNTNL